MRSSTGSHYKYALCIGNERDLLAWWHRRGLLQVGTGEKGSVLKRGSYFMYTRCIVILSLGGTAEVYYRWVQAGTV